MQRTYRLPEAKADAVNDCQTETFSGNAACVELQDIGGCRAVVDTVAQVEGLQAAHLKSSMKHRLVHQKNYVLDPKDSGYRGIHLVYRYRSDKKETYNGLLIEVQLRSRLQHAWATAVETAGAFLGQALKSSEGEADWLRFFSLARSVFAIREDHPVVPNTTADHKALRDEIREYGRQLRVVERMHEYRNLIKHIPGWKNRIGGHYFLLERRPDEGRTYIRPYPRRELDQATEDYKTMEARVAETDGADAVLVSVNSISALRRAYPNYWLDTDVFLEELGPILGDPPST